MSLRSQSDLLAAQGAAFRRDLASQPVTWQGKTYCVAVTGVKRQRQLEAGPFELQPECILRIPTAIYPKFTPALGDIIRVAGVDLRVTAYAALPNAAEIKVDLGQA